MPNNFQDPVKVEEQLSPLHLSLMPDQLALLPLPAEFANTMLPMSSMEMLGGLTFPAPNLNNERISLTAELSRAAFKSHNHLPIAPHQYPTHPLHSPSPMLESPLLFPATILHQQSPIQATQPLPSYSPMSFYFEPSTQLPPHMVSPTHLSISVPARGGSNQLCSMFEEAFPNSLSHRNPVAAPAPSKTSTHSPLPPLIKRHQSAPYPLNNSNESSPASSTSSSNSSSSSNNNGSFFFQAPPPKQRVSRTTKSTSNPDLKSPAAITTTTTTTATTIVDTRPRDFQCNICQNRFLRRQDLTRHEVTHTRSKEYVCPFGCGSCFGRTDALSRHMKGRRCSGGE